MAVHKGQKLVADERRKRNLIAVRLTDGELAGLNVLSEREGLPVSYFVRKGIVLVLREYEKRK